ncbi:MAG: hypothetical protein ACI9J3_004105, partial [Parvicellaceae bacterium]
MCTSQVYSQSSICDSAFRLVGKGEYETCQRLLKEHQLEPCTKQVTTSRSRSRPKKWFPGMMIVAILGAFGSRSSTTTHYLYEKVLDDSVSVDRDNLIRFMLTEPGQFNVNRSTSFMQDFVSNEENVKDLEMMSLLYTKCSYEGRLTAFSYSLENEIPAISNRFIAENEWRVHKKEIVKLLLESNRVDLMDSLFVHGLSPDIRFGIDSLTIPHLLTLEMRISEEKFYSNIEFFKKNNLDLWAKDAKGRTVLHQAMIKGRGRLPDLLIPICPDMNEQDKKGQTYLHYSVMNENIYGTKKLLEQGADFSIKDELGNAPGDYVDKWNVELLKLCGKNPIKEIENTIILQYYLKSGTNGNDSIRPARDAEVMAIVQSGMFYPDFNPNIKEEYSLGWSVISHAVEKQKIQLVFEMLKVYEKNDWPLPYKVLKPAESKANVKLTLMLLEAGANPRVLCDKMADRKYWNKNEDYPDSIMEWLKLNYLEPIYNDQTGKYHLEDYENNAVVLEFDSIIPFNKYRVTPVKVGSYWGLMDIAGTMAMNAKYDWVEVVYHNSDNYYVKTLTDGERNAAVINHFINYDVDEISGPEGVTVEDVWAGTGYGMKCITKKEGKYGVGIASSKRLR